IGSSELTVARVTGSGGDALQQGDYILAWNDTPLRDVFSLREQLIANTSPEVTLTILRNFQRLPVHLALKGIEVQRP
ncbi:hypothetical protein ACXYUI_33170, partial [Klebsiella pneumoniae]